MKRYIGGFLFLLFLIFAFYFLIQKSNNSAKLIQDCNQLNYEKLEILESKNFSKFHATLEILDWRGWQEINLRDQINFKKFNQFTNRKRTKAKLTINTINEINFSCKLDIAVRQHGDQKDHRDGAYLSSLQVKIIDGNIFGITDFLLLRPSQRGYYNEIFVTSLFKNMNLLAPRTSMVKITFNNQDYDFIFQEKIRKEFLENSNLKEGPIIEGDERFVFKKGDVPFVNHRISNRNYISKNLSTEHISEVALSKLNFYGSIHSTNTFRNSVIDYDSLSKLFANNDFENLDIFDAMMFVTDSLAGISVQDRRFYYEPINKKFYPIFYDGIPKLFDKNNKFITKKINYKNLINIQKQNFSFEFPSLFDGKVTESSVNGAIKALNSLREINLDTLKKDLNNRGFKISTKEIDQVLNVLSQRLLELSKFKEDKVLDLKTLNNDFFIHTFRNKRYEKNELLVFYSDNINQYVLCQVNYNNCYNINKNSVSKKKLLSQEEKISGKNLIYIGKNYNKSIEKKWYFERFENNFKKIEVDNFEFFMTEGIQFEYLKDQRLLKFIKNSLDSRVVFKNFKINNLNIIFNDLSSYPKSENKNFFLIDRNGNTGCITFYETYIVNLNFKIKNSKCEDAINFIRSEGTINSLEISDSISDALDFDFSNFKIDDILIKNSENDCSDFSYGDYKIVKLNVKDCGDKGISVGEESNVVIKNYIAKNTNIAVAAKDSSNLNILNAEIMHTKTCFSAYNKKQEFYGANLSVNSGLCQAFFKKLDIDKQSLFKHHEISKKNILYKDNLNTNNLIIMNTGHKIKSLIKDVSYKNSNNTFNAIIEISKGMREKWEINKQYGYLEHDFFKGNPRVLQTAYPVNYGIIPQTVIPINKGGDGDPLDVLILGKPKIISKKITIRVLGVMHMLDYNELDDKIIAVVDEDPQFEEVKNMKDLKKNHSEKLNQIVSWFENYKTIGVTKVNGFSDSMYAKQLIESGNKYYNKYGIKFR